MIVVYLLLLVLAAIVLGFLILYLEERYYAKHPEKERPEVSMWP
jgi:hypothetical protein